MTGLSFGKFGRDGKVPQHGGNETAREVIANHNANAGTFYNDELGETPAQTSSSSPSPSLYDELIHKLSMLLERNRGKNEDLSNIQGDTLSQVYYYGITAIMLYLLYKMLYRNNRK
jgi:hypothetical protein